MFHAAKAILFNEGIQAKTHKGIISLFREHIVKKGTLNEKHADALRRAFDLRQKSDYELYAKLDQELVKATIKNAEKLIAKIKETLKSP